MTKIRIETNPDGDWERMYVDGELVEEGHSIPLQFGLQALVDFLDIEVEMVEVGME